MLATATDLPPPPTPRAPDPGSPRAERTAWLLTIILGIAIVFIQQVGVSSKTTAKQAAPAPDAPLVDSFDPTLLTGKIIVKISSLVPPHQRGDLATNLDPSAASVEQAIALVPIIAELRGKDAALQLIDQIRNRNGASTITADLDLLHTIYTSTPSALAPEAQAQLQRRLGWAGDLALTFGQPDTDPARAAIFANASGLLVFLILVGLGILGAFFAGCAVLLYWLITYSSARSTPRLPRPVTGGSVGIETVALFMACFLALKLLSLAMGELFVGNLTGPAADAAEHRLTITVMILQWVILPIVLFWPTIRGLQQPDARKALGLHRGNGFIKEIAAGFLGYIACFPLLIAGAIASVLLMFAWQIIQKALGGTPPNPPANPLLDYFEQGPTLLILLATLAVIWAPIVEEVVFRGGLLRQLYTRTNIILAAIISSIVFAFMHGYPIIMLGSIIGLAMGLAMLRWFRGSLISCITAHAIHNALVSALLFTLVKLLG